MSQWEDVRPLHTAHCTLHQGVGCTAQLMLISCCSRLSPPDKNDRQIDVDCRVPEVVLYLGLEHLYL